MKAHQFTDSRNKQLFHGELLVERLFHVVSCVVFIVYRTAIYETPSIQCFGYVKPLI